MRVCVRACAPSRIYVRALILSPRVAMYAQAPQQVQVTQEMQHLREQVSNIDQMLRSVHPQPTLNSLNAQRITLMAKLQTMVRQQQPQIMQYAQGTPQQSISQAMQWMPPHPSQPRAPRRQMADPKEVQHRALAKLHMAPAPVPDQLELKEGAAAVQRRRGLLEAHDELERNNTWMQELLSPCDATTKQDPTESWDAIRERLAGWQVRPSHTSPPPSLGPTYCPPPVHARLPPRRRRGASSCKRSSRRSMRSCARASSRRLGVPPPPRAPLPPRPPSLPPSPPRPEACWLCDLSRARVRVVQDARRFNEALGTLKQATSLQVRHVARTPACGRPLRVAPLSDARPRAAGCRRRAGSHGAGAPRQAVPSGQDPAAATRCAHAQLDAQARAD